MLQKDIERFEIFGVDGKWLIKDNEQLPNLLDCYQSCVRLNEFAKRIAELEEQLKNAIVPKFKPHNDLFVIIDYINGRKIIEQYYIDEIVIRGNGEFIEYRDIGRQTIIGENNLLFPTKEEAEAKLKELKGETKC